MYDDKYTNPKLETNNIEEEHAYLNAYKEIISKTADLLKYIKIDNPFDASLIFQYLLWNGYFSKDKNFKYSKDNRCLARDAYGADIMRGYSVCLNNCDMLTRILNSLDIPSRVLYCSLKQEKLPNDNQFVNHIDNLSPWERFLRDHIRSNHAVVVFNHEDLNYVMDPTNNSFIEPIGYKKLKFFDTDDILKIRKGTSVLMNSLSDPFEEISASNPFEGISAISKDFDHIILNLFMQSKSKNSKINGEFVFEACVKSFKSYLTNIELFEDFHTEITPQIDTVCKTLRR